MLGFASCETDHDPRLNIPEEGSFVLNQPVFADQELVLAEGRTFELVASQPDYGFAATAEYGAEVSLTKDFTEFKTLKPIDTGLARMTFKDEDLAVALCELNGFDASHYEDLPAGEVFFRATCQIPGIENTAMVSNVVSMKKVKFYFAVQGERQIYLVGAISGWTEPAANAADHYKNFALNETAIGSNVFVGQFSFPAGETTFRFFTALNGWGDKEVQLGAGPDDMVDIEVEIDADGIYEGPYVCPGQSNWKVNIAAEGNVNITVDMNTQKIKLETGAEVNWDMYKCVYVTGNISGWVGPEAANAEAYAEWRLYDIAGNGIYVTKPGQPFTYDLTTGDPNVPMFRIYTALDGWGDDGCPWCVGSQAADSPVDVNLTDGVFTGTGVNGKGSWKFVDAPTVGTVDITYDSNTMQITCKFEAAAAE